MPTPFDNIIEKGLITINDYKLNNMAQTNPTAFQMRADSFVIKAIPQFESGIINKSLAYDLASRTILADLTNKEEDILSNYWAEIWFLPQVQDVTAFSNSLQNREFKKFAEYMSLREKSNYLDKIRAKNDWDISQYQSQSDNLKELFKKVYQ